MRNNLCIYLKYKICLIKYLDIRLPKPIISHLDLIFSYILGIINYLGMDLSQPYWAYHLDQLHKW